MTADVTYEDTVREIATEPEVLRRHEAGLTDRCNFRARPATVTCGDKH
jgi:hypothetical protein